jgi:hypothetical protein
MSKIEITNEDNMQLMARYEIENGTLPQVMNILKNCLE